MKILRLYLVVQFAWCAGMEASGPSIELEYNASNKKRVFTRKGQLTCGSKKVVLVATGASASVSISGVRGGDSGLGDGGDLVCHAIANGLEF